MQVIDNTLSPVKPSYPEPLIHRLPTELLQRIFLLIVHNVPDYPSIFHLEYEDDHSSNSANMISADFNAPPLLFTRVCCLWRTIAHSTTGLWPRIQVDLPRGYKPLKPFLPSLLRLWLIRSGNQPLTLHIEYRSFMVMCERDSYSEANSRLLEILLAERGRWETVTFASSVCHMEVQLDTLDTPQLRTLECDSSDLKIFHAPNLSHLRVTGFSYFDAFSSGPTPTTTNIFTTSPLRHGHRSNHMLHRDGFPVSGEPRGGSNLFWGL